MGNEISVRAGIKKIPTPTPPTLVIRCSHSQMQTSRLTKKRRSAIACLENRVGGRSNFGGSGAR